MTLEVALIILLSSIILFLLLVEVYTVLFRITGLSREKAIFQVVSLLTMCGFTTNESEVVLTTPLRRKIARATMITGMLFSVALVSLVINFITTFATNGIGNYFVILSSIALFILLAILFKKLKFLRIGFDKLIEMLAARLVYSKKVNMISVSDNFANKIIGEVHVKKLPECCDGKTIAEAKIRENYGINVLVIKRSNQSVNTSIKPTDQIYNGDRVIVFGDLNEIFRLFHPEQEKD